MIRLARAKDREAFLQLVARRRFPALPARELSSEQRRSSALMHYRQYFEQALEAEDLRVVVEEQEGQLLGYIVLLTGLRESITQEPQTLLFDYFGPPETLDRLLVHAERYMRPEDYIVVEIPPGDGDEEIFKARGYHLEMHRIIRRTRQWDLGGPYSVRRARSKDHLFLLSLNAICFRFTIPDGRRQSPGEIALNFLQAYVDLDLDNDPNLIPWLVEREGEPVGYLMLKLGYQTEVSGEEAAYIYDLAVHPEHWGRRATQKLMRYAESDLDRRGIAYMIGDISAANPRALKTSVKSLGFQVEWNRWSLAPRTEKAPAR